jgi:lipopolysaccharide/colanic/teichoic acid biosynthesis glycosyltransferase
MMFDFQNDVLEGTAGHRRQKHVHRHLSKASFDLCLSLMLLLPLLILTVVLVLINPFLNAGPLIFRQSRMGQDCRAFTAIKFRTMRVEATAVRGAFDALEADRIPPLGRFLRKSRLDELPQIINVLRGEMSLIGPRPDAFEHAVVYLKEVPDYARRYQALPGISGYAQTEVGYVDGVDGLHRKVAADLYYLANASFGFDLWITWRTLCVVLGCKGS